MANIRIALAQTSPISAPSGPQKRESPHSSSPFPSLEHNLVDAVDRVEKAKADGAEVLVFPEYFLQGMVNEGREYLTFPSRFLTDFLQQLAKKHGIAIVGTIVHGTRDVDSAAPIPTASPFSHIPLTSSAQRESVEHDPGKYKITSGQLDWAKYLEEHPLVAEETARPILRNTAFFIDEHGEVLGEYVKRNLWHPERDYITAGEEAHQIFETKWGKAGLLICWDISHPAAAQALSDQGVDIFFVPIYWLSTDSEPLLHKHDHAADYETSVVSALCMSRSFETETVWAMCNAGGDEMEGFMGGSGVWAPLRGRVSGLGSGTGLKLVNVDLGVLKDARATYKIREDSSQRQAT